MLSLRQERPHVEVIAVAPDELDGAVEHYHPDLVVCNRVTWKVHDSVPCWVEILVHENLDANVSIYERSSILNNVETKDLLQIVDEVERQLAGAT